jgi:thiamine-phosphate pyrophosphorylase
VNPPSGGAAPRERLRARIAGLYAIADDDPARGHSPLAVVDAALAGGVSVIQLRLKHATDREALALARAAVRRTSAAGALLIVNDRFDLADLAGADGVHLGQGDVAPESLPEAVRTRLLVGLSTHTLEQVEASRSRPVDYLGFGPIFATASKRAEYTARGIGLLRDAVRLAAQRVVAIWGIDLKTIAEVGAAGAAAAAVISALADAADPPSAARELGRAFARAPR